MNTLESVTTVNPQGDESTCAKFTIDDLSTPFKLDDIVNPDNKYILSFWVKSDATGSLTACGETITTSNTWLYETVAFTAIGEDVEFLFGTIGTYYLYNAKLEIGNKATDWTPAPEDSGANYEKLNASLSVTASAITGIVEKQTSVDGQIEYNKTQIEQLAEHISNLVVDANGASLMTQTADGGWVLNMADYDGAISGASDNIKDLFEKLGKVTDEDFPKIQEELLALGVKTSYIHEGEYNGQPCIELGENDSDFKLRITNTEIQFLVGSNPAAWITNEKMNIRKAEITEELQMGGFAWVKHGSNNNMGLIWRGVSS